VRHFNAGDEDTFVEIMTRHHGRVFSIALFHLRNCADAEEITQDTFIRAHRGLARFRCESSLGTWLHRIVSNLSRNRHKYYSCRRRHASVANHWTFGRKPRPDCSNDRYLDAAFDDALRDGVAGKACRVVDVQLVHQMLPMLFNRLDADL
jgi:RNA polymerase sigma factor (sigma-70 family)